MIVENMWSIHFIKIHTSNRVIVSTSNDKFDEWQSKERFNFLSPLGEDSFLDYLESVLSLIVREIIRWLFNHQLILFSIRSKSIFLWTKLLRFQTIVVASVYCLLFSTSKNKDLNWVSKIATNAVLELKFF